MFNIFSHEKRIQKLEHDFSDMKRTVNKLENRIDLIRNLLNEYHKNQMFLLKTIEQKIDNLSK